MNNCYLHNDVQVFISYRREGGRDVARNIYDRLSLAGFNTFFDYNSMQNGVIDPQIYKAIEKATDFVLILSKDALNRCYNSDDWVRKEIEHALLQNKNIVLLSTDEIVEFPDNLPESLRTLRSRQVTFLSQVYYDRSIEQLKSALVSKPVKYNHIFYYFLWMFVIFIIVCVLWFGMSFLSSKNNNPMTGYQATAFLMRYDNLRLRYDCDINDTSFSLFHYDDSIDQQSVMHIYPVSDYIDYQPGQTAKLVSANSIMTIKNANHLPTIQLKLHSMNKQTLVLTSAELQIDEYRYDDQPAFCFTISDHKLEVYNIGALVVYKGVIEYSILREG